MARIETDPNYSTPTFSRATAPADIFKKEDVQNVAAALSTHDHSTGKGLVVSVAGLGAGSIPAAAIADGSITSAKIADGAIATVDLANASVTNAKLASDTARANLLTNGGFEVWQRGNGPFTSGAGAFGCDRWIANLLSGTISWQRDTTNQDTASGVCAAIVFTGPGNIQNTLLHKVEDHLNLRGKTLTLSIRVRTSTANAVRCMSQASGGAYIYGAYHTGGGAYETLSLTFAVPTNTTSLYVGVTLEASCTAYVDNAMLVVGSVAADYAPLHPADDLDRCLRYYELLGTPGIGDYAVSSYNGAAAPIFFPATYKAIKAITPTVTKVGTWTTANCSQPTVTTPSVSGFQLGATITALGYGVIVNSTAGNTFTVESNP